MTKRQRSTSPELQPNHKRSHASSHSKFAPIKIASAEAAAAVDSDTPFSKLVNALKDVVRNPPKGDSVVYWMRFSDLRVSDNRALSLASIQAQKDGVPLIALFVLSPQDYIAHDRGARRIDFVLRNLAVVKTILGNLNIPLQILNISPRKAVPMQVVSFLEGFSSRHLFANIEHEVDELRRDLKICNLLKDKAIKANYIHDKCIVEPGIILTKQNKVYSVYSPYQKNWLAIINADINRYVAACPYPLANMRSIYDSEKLSILFDTPVPVSLGGFVLDERDQLNMSSLWPAGEEAASEILKRFLCSKSRTSQLGAVDPLAPGFEECDKNSRVLKYNTERDRADRDTTSRLSPYLTSGVISSRACIRGTMEMLGIKHVEGSGSSGVGRWVQEIAWRDFYNCILAFFPRISMGRPYLEKFSEVIWENHQRPGDITSQHHDQTTVTVDTLARWKAGTTGVPIVDAAMRCINEMGWVHNRARMICAMYLSKDLMIDWRVGERYFMENLIDGDLASNNGGWQWCASTGTDPCPYFRIFNPYTQSTKIDPTGNFIRNWVPELKMLKGPDLHDPSPEIADKMGYPRAIIAHKLARERALRRYKTPGTK